MLKSLSVSIDRDCFSIDRNSWIKLFLKVKFELFTSLFQNVFKLLFLSPIRTSTILNFLSFSTKYFAGFSSPKAGMSIIPYLFHLSSILHALKGYFRTMHKLGLLMFQALFCEIDRWALLIYCYIHDLYWLIWSIWGFMMNSKF